LTHQAQDKYPKAFHDRLYVDTQMGHCAFYVHDGNFLEEQSLNVKKMNI